jgi:hypothetical protein
MRNHMFEPTAAMLGLVTLVVAAPVIFGGDTLAADSEVRAAKTRPALFEKHPVTTRATKKESPADARADGDASSRCRPDEDIACTVIRETAQGVLIVTYRASATGAAATERKTWAVVSGAPAGAPAASAGTVYVVPSLPQNQVAATGHSATATAALPNGAPILE